MSPLPRRGRKPQVSVGDDTLAPPVAAMNPFDHSTRLKHFLDDLGAGDSAARDALIGRTFGRLRALAHRMFRGQPGLHAAVETDDVLQGAAVRLHRCLPEVRPATVHHFFALASLQIRRELIDLARHHLGAHGAKAARAVEFGESDSGGRGVVAEPHEGPPADLEGWTRFHEAAAGLPGEERATFDLLWYHDLSQAEAADILQVSERTVKRRWRSARLLLHQSLRGEWPGSERDGGAIDHG